MNWKQANENIKPHKPTYTHLTRGIWKSAAHLALRSHYLRGEIRENGDTTLTVKQRPSHGNPGCILMWRSDVKVDIPHTCPPVLNDQSRRRKEQSKQSYHKASSRVVVCIFHVKWKANEMPSRMWGIFLFSVFQARSFWVKERKKDRRGLNKLVSKAEKRVEMRGASWSSHWEKKESNYKTVGVPK